MGIRNLYLFFERNHGSLLYKNSTSQYQQYKTRNIDNVSKIKLRDRCWLQINLDHVNKKQIQHPKQMKKNMCRYTNIIIGGDHKVKPKVKVESKF